VDGMCVFVECFWQCIPILVLTVIPLHPSSSHTFHHLLGLDGTALILEFPAAAERDEGNKILSFL